MRFLFIFVAVIGVAIEAPALVKWFFEKPTHVWYRGFAMVLLYILVINAIIGHFLLARYGLKHPADLSSSKSENKVSEREAPADQDEDGGTADKPSCL